MAFDAVRADWRALCICAFINIAAFQFGYDSSYYSGILAMQPFLRIYGEYSAATGEYAMSAAQQSLTTSIINAGEFVGAVTAYVVGDRFGRKGGLYISSAVVLVGTTIQVASTHVASLIVGRLVLGYAVGLISCFVPLYVADCAPKAFRGFVVSLYQQCIGLGLVTGVVVDYCSKDRTDTGAFRIPMAIQYVFPLVLLPGLWFMCPESPRWLVQKGRLDEARAALVRLRGPMRPELIDAEMLDLETQLGELEAQRAGSWAELFRGGSESRKAWLGFSLQALQQGTGINFITGYGVVFFVAIGISNAYVIEIGLYLVAMPVVLASGVLVDRMGRRGILMLSGAFVVAVLVTMGGAGLAPTKTPALDRLVVAMCYLFLVAFNLGWGPSVWVVCAEISTGRNRSRLMSLSTGANWFFTWLISFTFPYLDDADAGDLQSKIGFVYGAATLVAVAWVFFFLPETKGRSLEEIDLLFRNGTSVRNFGRDMVVVSESLVLTDKEGVEEVRIEAIK